jgi:hypothetical protein
LDELRARLRAAYHLAEVAPRPEPLIKEVI